jgi:hypothetical protein
MITLNKAKSITTTTKNFGNYTNSWKLNNILLKNQCIKEENIKLSSNK